VELPKFISRLAMKHKKRRRPREDAAYVCDACGEEIVIPIDLSAGENQEYVEDCPVCCRPNVIHVEIDDRGQYRVWAEAE
jgi:hypothetical protein